MTCMVEAYMLAQRAMADLKTAVLMLLSGSSEGLRNVDIGKALGIYAGHVRHEGHIPRTLLEMMAQEGTVRQDKDTQRWYMIRRSPELSEPE